jgi:hypothetical protein
MFGNNFGLKCGLEFSASRRMTPEGRMAGTTRLELATSAVTVGKPFVGACRMNRLRVRLSAFIGLIGLHWAQECNELCNGLTGLAL